jgi:hypothetical protein
VGILEGWGQSAVEKRLEKRIGGIVLPKDVLPAISAEEAEIRKELKVLKSFLKEDSRFAQVARELPNHLERFWWEIQDEYPAWMGSRLRWYVQALVRLEEIRHPPHRKIRNLADYPPPGDTPADIERSCRPRMNVLDGSGGTEVVRYSSGRNGSKNLHLIGVN